MKMFMVFALLLVSGLTSAASPADNIRMKFTQSAEVKDTIAKLEAQHGVSCGSGKARTFLPRVFGQIAYVTYCARPSGTIKVRLSASFKDNEKSSFLS